MPMETSTWGMDHGSSQTNQLKVHSVLSWIIRSLNMSLLMAYRTSQFKHGVSNRRLPQTMFELVRSVMSSKYECQTFFEGSFGN